MDKLTTYIICNLVLGYLDASCTESIEVRGRNDGKLLHQRFHQENAEHQETVSDVNG